MVAGRIDDVQELVRQYRTWKIKTPFVGGVNDETAVANSPDASSWNVDSVPLMYGGSAIRSVHRGNAASNSACR